MSTALTRWTRRIVGGGVLVVGGYLALNVVVGVLKWALIVALAAGLLVSGWRILKGGNKGETEETE